MKEQSSLCSQFGNCPHCGSNDGYVNVRWRHWFICKKHKTKWLPAMNIFPEWIEGTEDLWSYNASMLDRYEEIRPLQVTSDIAAV